LEHALTWDELEAIARDGAPASGLVALEANSFDETRSADVVLLHRAWCLPGLAAGTTHGTPYEYDRRVPLAFYGPGVAPGCDFTPAASIDALPTLIGLLGVDTGAEFDGRDLFRAR
jgi:arylsulfatase A-like enzyme